MTTNNSEKIHQMLDEWKKTKSIAVASNICELLIKEEKE